MSPDEKTAAVKYHFYDKLIIVLNRSFVELKNKMAAAEQKNLSRGETQQLRNVYTALCRLIYTTLYDTMPEPPIIFLISAPALPPVAVFKLYATEMYDKNIQELETMPSISSQDKLERVMLCEHIKLIVEDCVH